jgi:hypothetical protein
VEKHHESVEVETVMPDQVQSLSEMLAQLRQQPTATTMPYNDLETLPAQGHVIDIVPTPNGNYSVDRTPTRRSTRPQYENVEEGIAPLMTPENLGRALDENGMLVQGTDDDSPQWAQVAFAGRNNDPRAAAQVAAFEAALKQAELANQPPMPTPTKPPVGLGLPVPESKVSTVPAETTPTNGGPNRARRGK